LQQVVKARVDSGRLNKVVVVQDQDERLRLSVQFPQELVQEGLDGRWLTPAQVGQCCRAEAGAAGLERRQHPRPEALRASVARLERYPSDCDTRADVDRPFGEQGRLAKTGWADDQSKRTLQRSIESSQEPRTRHDPRPRHRGRNFARQRWPGRLEPMFGRYGY